MVEKKAKTDFVAVKEFLKGTVGKIGFISVSVFFVTTYANGAYMDQVLEPHKDEQGVLSRGKVTENYLGDAAKRHLESLRTDVLVEPETEVVSTTMGLNPEWLAGRGGLTPEAAAKRAAEILGGLGDQSVGIKPVKYYDRITGRMVSSATYSPVTPFKVKIPEYNFKAESATKAPEKLEYDLSEYVQRVPTPHFVGYKKVPEIKESFASALIKNVENIPHHFQGIVSSKFKNQTEPVKQNLAEWMQKTIGVSPDQIQNNAIWEEKQPDD